MMLAPGATPTNKDFVENKDKPNISFVVKNSRIRLLGNGKDIGGEQILGQKLNEMLQQVKQSQAGHSVTTMKDFGAGGAVFKRHGIKSTFPQFFRDAGFKTKKEFVKAMKRKTGPAFKRIVSQAISDLQNGSETNFGNEPPNKDFLVKTKQLFDNRNIIFRTIDGKVVPIRTNMPHQIEDKVPF